MMAPFPTGTGCSSPASSPSPRSALAISHTDAKFRKSTIFYRAAGEDKKVNLVLEVQGVSKRFRVQRNRPATLKELFIQRLNGRYPAAAGEHWALREISIRSRRGIPWASSGTMVRERAPYCVSSADWGDLQWGKYSIGDKLEASSNWEAASSLR